MTPNEYILNQYLALLEDNKLLKEKLSSAEEALNSQAKPNTELIDLSKQTKIVYKVAFADKFEYDKISLEDLKGLRDGKLSLRTYIIDSFYNHPLTFTEVATQFSIIDMTTERMIYISINTNPKNDDHAKGTPHMTIIENTDCFATYEEAFAYGKKQELDIINAIIAERTAEKKIT